jgi:hypothetical protein
MPTAAFQPPRARAARPGRLALLIAAVSWAAAAPAAGGAEADPRFDDFGAFTVWRDSLALGTEVFSFEPHGDSLFVFSRARQALPRRDGGVDSLDKNVGIVFSASDFDLRGYESHQRLAGRILRRELRLNDTSFAAYRQDDVGGSGLVHVRPPGRLFVIDAEAFVLFDVLLRYTLRSSLDDRQVPAVFLGPSDTTFYLRVRRLGMEPIRWGGRTVQASKLAVAAASGGGWQYLAWMSPEGRMLRLTLAEIGLRVERDREPPPLDAQKRPGVAPAKPRR